MSFSVSNHLQYNKLCYADILDVMTVHEIDNPDSLTGLMKERIYKASGMGPTEVSRLLFVYKQSLVVHTWLQEKLVRKQITHGNTGP